MNINTLQKASALIQKYDIPTPRYTSYPTVPFWQDNLALQEWENQVRKANLSSKEGLSLYIHLPFCEKLCTYCGCNKRITINHQVEQPYLQSLLKEWQLYLQILGEKPLIREIHLGGGTPTFFSAQNLAKLLEPILKSVQIHPDFEFGLEVHPNVTNYEQLKTLYDLGFRRLSAGVQDFDPQVQAIINRFQTFEQTQQVIEDARSLGYQSINVDIIYGLPLQTAQSIEMTVEKIKILRPERLAFYSYAHVPWKSKAQRRYTEADLPQGAEKRALYELGREAFFHANYYEIGLDHFALAEDALYQSLQNGTLHRNFMGYTPRHTQLLIGLGASSISDSWGAYLQNEKEIENYQALVNQGNIPIFKGHLLSIEEKIIRKIILQILCQGKLDLQKFEWNEKAEALARLQDLVKDELIILENNQLQVTDLGRAFLRNIAVQFDTAYWEKQSEEKMFSRSV
jgi:oxygen-independent coproporphyrinogen-3 oxidase